MSVNVLFLPTCPPQHAGNTAPPEPHVRQAISRRVLAPDGIDAFHSAPRRDASRIPGVGGHMLVDKEFVCVKLIQVPIRPLVSTVWKQLGMRGDYC